MRVNCDYTINGSGSGSVDEYIPVPSGLSKARIVSGRVAANVDPGDGETLTLYMGDNAIGTFTLGSAVAAGAGAELVLSATYGKSSLGPTASSNLFDATDAVKVTVSSLTASAIFHMGLEWDGFPLRSFR